MFRMLWVPLLFIALPVWAESTLAPLVDVNWLLTQKDHNEIVVVDIQPTPYYQQVHLKGAISIPFDQWRAASPQGLRGMMPTVSSLEKMLGQQGVSQDNAVLIVTTGLSAGDMAAAARVFWTLKVLGHSQVAILDGGLQAVADHARAASQLTNLPGQRASTVYRASPDMSLLADSASTVAAIRNGEQLIDARTSGEFLGVHTGSEHERAGSLPGAYNLPFDWVTENGSGKLLPPSRLRSLLKAIGVDPAARQVHYCHSGNRASLTWFAAYAMLGNKQARLYDASMLEWAVQPDLPMERRVQF